MSIPGRANTPTEKVEFMRRLMQVWLRYPDLRFGQLIIALTSGRDIFSTEDFPLIQMFENEGIN